MPWLRHSRQTQTLGSTIDESVVPRTESTFATTLRHLGPKEVFGDLSALDPDDRTVSVTAVEETLLLHMEHSTLMDVMEEHVEVAHGIIRFLVRRFRAGRGPAPWERWRYNSRTRSKPRGGGGAGRSFPRGIKDL